jgi:hypothetical protein
VFSNSYLFSNDPHHAVRAFDLITPQRGAIYGALLKKNFIATSTVVVRKSLLNELFVGTVCEDWKMWLSVARKGIIDFVEEPLVYYYEHSQGLSKSKGRLILARIQIRKEEHGALKVTNLHDKRLMNDVKFLIFKDMLFLQFIKILPERILKKINSSYYNSQTIRKIMSKTTISN